MSVPTVIADDHPVVLAGLEAMLAGSDVQLVGRASDGKSAVDEVRRTKPQVLVTDVRMPRGDGFWVLEQVRTDIPGLQVVMLSNYDYDQYVARAIALGAADYLVKSCSRLELIDSVTRAAAGLQPASGTPFHHIKALMTKRWPSRTVEPNLTGRQFQVLVHIALGLTNLEISRSLGISIETVKEHVQTILRQCQLPDRTAAAVYAARKAYI